MSCIAAPLSLLADSQSTLLFPPSGSTIAPEVDWLFNFIFWLCAVFFVIILGVMILFVVLYRQRPGHTEQPSPSHSEPLEIGWSVIPSILVGFIFFFGFIGFLNVRQPPEDAYEIQVTAYQWAWEFTYPNGARTSGDLHLPADRPIVFTLMSKDVIHSFSVPAFRIKMDCVPGRFNQTWAKPTQTTGVGPDENHQPYDLFCTEYCGTGHSNMNRLVYVHEPAEFDQWLEKASDLVGTYGYLEAGQQIYQQRCSTCHSIDGTKKVGPSFLNSFGTERQVIPRGESAPVTVEMDYNYVMESIREPGAKIVAGYKPGMPVFDSRQLKDDEILAIIIYLKSISETTADQVEAEIEELNKAKAAGGPRTGQPENSPSGNS